MYPLYEENAEGIDRLHCIMIIEDVSRRIAYEEGIFQAEKLASISMLSAGVAHEINNPLSSILINVQNLIESSRDESALSDLRIIEEETKRIAESSGICWIFPPPSRWNRVAWISIPWSRRFFSLFGTR